MDIIQIVHKGNVFNVIILVLHVMEQQQITALPVLQENIYQVLLEHAMIVMEVVLLVLIQDQIIVLLVKIQLDI